mgnify:CR=1 FL=1
MIVNSFRDEGLWPVARASLLAEQFTATQALRHGLTWYFNRPPVVDLEYEMDCRAVFQEHVMKV